MEEKYKETGKVLNFKALLKSYIPPKIFIMAKLMIISKKTEEVSSTFRRG
jgi:hypothetical protein